MEIQGYSNYLIYPDGRVFSKKSNRFLRPKILNGKDYYYIQVCKNSKIKNFLIHRLIAIHYIPNPENKPQVNHIDGNKKNNVISNLEWVTNMENGNRYQNDRIGIRCILKNRTGWEFDKRYYGKRYRKWFKTKTEAICYKYIFTLRIRAGHFN